MHITYSFDVREAHKRWRVRLVGDRGARERASMGPHGATGVEAIGDWRTGGARIVSRAPPRPKVDPRSAISAGEWRNNGASWIAAWLRHPRIRAHVPASCAQRRWGKPDPQLRYCQACLASSVRWSGPHGTGGVESAKSTS